MFQIIPSLEKVIQNGNIIFRWYSNRMVEYCDMDKAKPIFKILEKSKENYITVNDSEKFKMEAKTQE